MIVDASAPPTSGLCLEVGHGIHAIVLEGRCLICLPRAEVPPDDDDRGDTLIRSTIRRDRYGAAR